MDDSCTENNSLMKVNNKQLQNPSNKKNLSSENHSITDSKSNLPTRKQRLKEYITATHTPDKNINSTHEVQDISTVHLINFVPKIDDYNKPVKVKSQWTRTSQMELQLENSASFKTEITLPVINLFQTSKKINETMDVSPLNGEINQLNDHTKKNNHTLNFDKHCRVVVHKFDDKMIQVKRKRGRPKKTVNAINDSPSIVSKTCNEDLVKTNSIAVLEPKTSGEPKVIKRGRGRPKKNEITLTNIQSQPIVSNSGTKKTRKKIKVNDRLTHVKKRNIRLLKKQSNSDESEVNENSCKTSNASISPVVILPKDDYKLKYVPYAELDIFKASLITPRITLERCDKLIPQKKISPISVEKCDDEVIEDEKTACITLKTCDSLQNITECKNSVNVGELNVQEDTTCIKLEKSKNVAEKVDGVTSTKIKITEFSRECEPDVFSDLENVNWNILPKRIRSNSVNKPIKSQQRRNSLSDNFKYKPTKTIINKNLNLIKPWKSLSCLEDGPNYLKEHCERDILDKKYKSELKRSRSFTNCSFLDTVIWRFLAKQQKYGYGDNYLMLTYYSDMTLINELSVNRYNRHCRSKSVPIEQYEQPKVKTNHMFRSSDDLNMLCHTNNLQPFHHSTLPPFQLPHVEYNLLTPRITLTRCDDLLKTPLNTVGRFDVQESSDPDESEGDTEESERDPEESEGYPEESEGDPEESEGKIRRSARLHRKPKNDMVFKEEDLKMAEKQKIEYLKIADEIRQENEIQLLKLRQTDPELDNKLKILNFKLISNNLFRPNKKKMSEYTPAEAQELRKLKPRITSKTVYQCQCSYSKKDYSEGKPGCSIHCLNRLLNIECTMHCPIRAVCTNNQFQNKQFKRTEVVKTPDKGYGVFALEDIAGGTFIDEYMGEVINQQEMLKRMNTKSYKNNNYMVQLTYDEIIDATCKGNITRYINHSCEPNCVAEKWIVLGESRMGFFSKNFIQKGEEITFNYSFEIFGDTAQQKCYCGTPKCRGFISKKSRDLGDVSSSDESDDELQDDMLIVKPDVNEGLKKKTPVKKISNKNKKRLRELDQQLTDISKLKNKNRSDLENSTLNLNKLMVHITDSMSRSHILKFIRDNDLNCKRLFMNFNGLNIIHNWMTSKNSRSLKLEIIKTLSDLPISNRNTITKSKVLDIVAQWANIPLNIKKAIENLNYPISQIEKHEQEIDKLLPDVNKLPLLVQAARVLWKKWIVLKMVFKIPKLDRPKEGNIPDDAVSQPPIPFSQPKPNVVPYHFGKPTVPAKINYVQNQSTGYLENNSMDKLSKIINHHKQINNQNKNKAVFEWNKKHWNYMPFKTNKLISSAMVNNSSKSVLNPKQSSTSTFKSRDIQDIPTIESCTLSKNLKRSSITEINSKVYELPTSSSAKINSTNLLSIKEPIEYSDIEVIITTKQTWNSRPPTIADLYNTSTLHSMLKTVPPCLPNDLNSNSFNKTSQYLTNNENLICTMRPENVMYDSQHPSIQEQLDLLPINITVTKSIEPHIDTPDTEKANSDKNYQAIHPINEVTYKELLKQCEENKQKLIEKGILNVSKSAKENYIDQSPMKIHPSFFTKKPKFKSNVNSVPNLLKCLKIATNGYRKQPSKIIEINNLIKANCEKSKNDTFRIKEVKETEITDIPSIALKLQNEVLSTFPKKLNLNKVFNNQKFKVNTKNRFAVKLLNGYIKKLTLPKSFHLQFPPDTKIKTHDPSNELELHNKLIPSVQNVLCAKLYQGDGRDTVNVFKQKVVMKYDETKIPVSLESILKENAVLSVNTIDTHQVRKQLKRKLPLPPMHDLKSKKIVDLSVKNIRKSRNQATMINETNDDAVFKKPMPPVINKNNSLNTGQVQEPTRFNIETLNTNANEFKPKPSTSRQLIPNIAFLKTNANNFMLVESCTSSQLTSDVLSFIEPNTSYQENTNITMLNTNANEIRKKPLMKCSPFNNKVDSILITELEQNAEHLARSISIDSTYVSTTAEVNSELIDPVVENFKKSVRTNLVDDPIVRDFLQRTQSKTLETKRKCKLPESMMSLPDEVLNLVPDNQREIKYVIDFYHSMATVIVKVLDLYVKKSCKQGRIKNDNDFKYLAKKLNSNILLKELQVKKVEDLRISDSVKQKVEQYIKRYMLKHGKVYKRKNTD